jgi:hypothetical protein
MGGDKRHLQMEGRQVVLNHGLGKTVSGQTVNLDARETGNIPILFDATDKSRF